MPFQYTFRADDITTWEAETRDLVENRDRELELYSTTIDDSFLNLNASNLTSGTVPSARMTGAYPGITDLGALTSLDVQTTTGTAVRITNTGTGDSFLVEDSASTDATPFVINAAGNVGIGVSSPSNALDVSGNVQITGGNIIVGGQGTFFNTSAEDGIILTPRIGGTGSYRVVFTPTTLSASRTVTLPNATGTMITTGNLSSITAVGTITSGTWSGSFGAVSGANLTTLNASNISSGTLANARLPAAATTITSVGTLTGLTTSGLVTISRGALGTTAGNELVFIDPNGTTSNGDKLDTRLIRSSNGTDWTTAVWRMGRLVDATRMGFIQFGDGAGAQDVRLGVGTTTYGIISTGGLSVSSNIYVSASGSNFIANNPSTGTGNAAQWVNVLGVYVLFRNTSTRDDKENFQPLNGIVTPRMIDDIEISLWNRKGATGFPEIGPMAEDMDDISPFLSIRGMDCDEDGNIIATPPGGINQNAWLSLLTLGIQDLRKRVEQLETT